MLQNIRKWIKPVRPIVYKKLAPGVFVIGKYQPDTFDAKKIGEELLDMTSGLDVHPRAVWRGDASYNPDIFHFTAWYKLDVGAEVRPPDSNIYTSQFKEAASLFHHDGVSEDSVVVVWSNREQTEIQLADGTIIHGEPGDVIALRNEQVLHRTPEIKSTDRWFFRRYVKPPEWMNDTQ